MPTQRQAAVCQLNLLLMADATSPRSTPGLPAGNPNAAVWKQARQGKGHEGGVGRGGQTWSCWRPRASCPGAICIKFPPNWAQRLCRGWAWWCPACHWPALTPQRHPSYQPTPTSGFNPAQLAASGSVLHMAACPDGARPGGLSPAPSTAAHWAEGPQRKPDKRACPLHSTTGEDPTGLGSDRQQEEP